MDNLSRNGRSETTPAEQPSKRRRQVRADAAFRSEVYRIGGHMVSDSEVSGALDDDLQALGFDRDGWSILFAYMHRRFGPPNASGDDYKDLSAAWIISTPDPDVCLMVSPSLVGPRFGFHPYFPRNWCPSRHQDLDPGRAQQVRAAAVAALRDLLRPVCVRDSYLNAQRQVERGSRLLGRWSEDGGYALEAKRASTSGYAVPEGTFGTQGWTSLVRTAAFMGDGDIADGWAQVACQARTMAMRGLVDQPVAVQELVAAAALCLWKDPDRTEAIQEVDRAGCLGSMMVAAEGLASAMKSGYRNEAPEVDARTILPLPGAAEVVEAQRWVDLLGADIRLGKMIATARRKASDVACWRELVAAEEQEGFPAGLMDRFAAMDVWSVMSPAADAGVAEELEAAGKPRLAAWARAWAGETGSWGMNLVEASLYNAAKTIEQAPAEPDSIAASP